MDGPLRIATFNIRHGLGRDGRVDLERTAAAIKQTEARLIGLQEVDRGRTRSGRVDQAAALADLTGLRIDFHPTLVTSDGEYGLALAAADHVTSELLPLARAADEEPRGALLTTWRGIEVIATHLSTVPAARRAQLQQLAALVEGRTTPTVVMGDFNERSPSLGPLEGTGLSPARPARMARMLFRRPIDHVLAGRGATVTRAWFINSDASDHLPLVAELRV